jgi:ankyrin repeat protein
MVRWLIGKGLDVNEANNEFQTAMSFAASNGPVENLRILIEHGAKANHPRIDGRTPFLIAALCGREEICRFLLFNGHASMNEIGTAEETSTLVGSTAEIDVVPLLRPMT